MTCSNCNVRDALPGRDVCSVCMGFPAHCIHGVAQELVCQKCEDGKKEILQEQIGEYIEQQGLLDDLVEEAQKMGMYDTEEEVHPWCFHCGGTHFSPECGQDSPRSEREIKEKENKPPVQHIPSLPLFEVAKVIEAPTKPMPGFPDGKYYLNQWREEPTSVMHRIGSAMRHIFKFKDGWENNDRQTKTCNLANAIAQLMYALYYYETDPNLDDRPYKPED